MAVTSSSLWGGPLIAERSKANNRDLWASESQLAFICNHGQEVYISDIPPAVEEVYGNIPLGPAALVVYSHKPPSTSRWYITDIHRLDMVHILYIMLNFDQNST